MSFWLEKKVISEDQEENDELGFLNFFETFLMLPGRLNVLQSTMEN